LHQDKKGQLDIELTEEDDQLFFRIKDNGIGRNQAALLGSKSATKHKSMGMQITGERIAQLQRLGAKESSVRIYDLMLMDGRAGGTEVIIKIPVMYD
jgi:two-component sensor histidine kinase